MRYREGGKSFPSAWAQIVPYLDQILTEPEFRKTFREGLELYMTEGQDLNPYVDNKALKLPELPRVLNYEIENLPLLEMAITAGGEVLPMNNMTLMTHRMKVFWDFRGSVIRDLRVSEQVQRNIRFMGMQVHPVGALQNQISQYVQNPNTAEVQIQTVYEFYLPLIYEIHQEYLQKYNTPDKQETNPFLKFFVNHPSVYLSPANDGVRIVVPYVTNNIIWKIIQKVREYKACIENRFVSPCENEEDKKAYVQWFHSAYF